MEDNHWTQDDELIERFILNTLNPEERNELEDHLRICEVCKQEVRAQQLLVAGMRRSGREAFKAKLREKVGLLPEKQIPWPHILSAAAVIVILLSVGVYNRWFETVKQPENTIVLIRPDVAPAAVSKDSIENVRPSVAAAPPEEKAAATVDRSSQMSRKKKEMKSRTASDLDALADGDKPAAMQTGNGAQGAVGISSQAQPAQEVQADIVLTPEVVWAEGTVLPSEEELLQKGKSEKRGIPNATYRLGKADAMRAAPSSAQKQAARESSLLVTQQSTSSIPLSQQQLRQPDKVLTKVERLGEQIQFTVYLDSLVDESDLARTTIEPGGNDSVVVNLPNQKIRYKLPSGWNKQLLTKPAK